MSGRAPAGRPSRGLLWPTVLTAAALAVLAGLGTWQVQRLAWKTRLVATVEMRVAAEPAPLPGPGDWPGVDLEALEYRPYAATGRFDHGRELYQFIHLPDPSGRHGGAGYWVITPFILDGGGTVMVNRGFVPEAFRDPATRPRGQVDGAVKIFGLLRLPEAQGSFVPDNDIARNVWFYRDIAAMGRAAGYPDAAPFLLDERANGLPGGLPQAGETRLTFKNDHLQYALTWYGLAVCLAGVYTAFWIGRRQHPGDRT